MVFNLKIMCSDIFHFNLTRNFKATDCAYYFLLQLILTSCALKAAYQAAYKVDKTRLSLFQIFILRHRHLGLTTSSIKMDILV